MRAGVRDHTVLSILAYRASKVIEANKGAGPGPVNFERQVLPLKRTHETYPFHPKSRCTTIVGIEHLEFFPIEWTWMTKLSSFMPIGDQAGMPLQSSSPICLKQNLYVLKLIVFIFLFEFFFYLSQFVHTLKDTPVAALEAVPRCYCPGILSVCPRSIESVTLTLVVSGSLVVLLVGSQIFEAYSFL
jgi:hypothetical protein